MVLPPNAVTKRSVSDFINLRCAGIVFLCSMDFVSGWNIQKNNWLIHANILGAPTQRQLKFYFQNPVPVARLRCEEVVFEPATYGSTQGR